MKSTFYNILILLSIITIPNFSQAQLLHQYQLDTVYTNTNWLAYSTQITLQDNKVYHSFVHNKREEFSFYSLGDITINVYNEDGTLLEQEKSNLDSLYIRKTIITEDGDKIILAKGQSHLSLYDLDTTITLNPWLYDNDFILIVNNEGNTIHFLSLNVVHDITYDEEQQQLFFIDQIVFDTAKLYRWNISTNIIDTLSTITHSRFHPRIAKTHDYIYISGATINFAVGINDTVITTEEPYATFIAQLNNDGDMNWIKLIPDVTTSHINLSPVSDQGVYFNVTLYQELILGSDTLEGPTWGSDFYLTRISKDGEFLWAQELPNNDYNGFDLGIGYSMDTDADDNVYIIGTSKKKIIWDNGFQIGDASSISNVPTMLQYNKDGIIQNAILEENYQEGTFFSIDVAENGDFAITGVMLDSLTFSGETKTPTTGFITPFFLWYKNGSTSIENLPEIKNDIFIYPNPIASNTPLYIHRSNNQSAKLSIQNIVGQTLLNQTLHSTFSTIDIQCLNPGLYIILIDGKYVQKLIVR